MQFDYRKQKQVDLDPERKKIIEIGYAQADERKRKENRNRVIFWVDLVLAILIILWYVLIKK